MSKPYFPEFMFPHKPALVHKTVYAVKPAFCRILPQQVFLAISQYWLS